MAKPKKQDSTAADKRRAARPAAIDPNQYYSVHEYAAARDASVATAWKDVNSQRVKSVRDGKRVKILGAEIIRVNLQQSHSTVQS